MSLVTPAVLPSSKEDLEEKLALFARIPLVSRIQIDVVDGKFATPASWPYTALAELENMVKSGQMLPRLDSIEYEIDLMCLDAERAASLWLALGATRIIFHAESATDLPRLLASSRKRFGAGDGFASGLISYGLALNVSTDLALIEPCLGEIEFIQCMGIAKIGQQGQPFDKRVLEKVRTFRKRHPEIPVQVDGGITIVSARELVALDVTNLVVGSGILKAADPAKAFAALDGLQNSFGV
jgi:ribulose-phosphate 3-epimerase